ncbi:hypothetical protein AQUCO_05100063v1 [Aquilegia coerulea]|uniref:Transmembrane protein n=2 Tax=Aquilegia coerulea TaxID=218851 RepID=A0A2G5CJ13_AQUCA|nr:hypothetical protein AQUCO_05100063v1 [Aquilegia coerulea]
MLHSHFFLSPKFSLTLSSSSYYFPIKQTPILVSLQPHIQTRLKTCFAQRTDTESTTITSPITSSITTTTTPPLEDGPIELPPSSSSIFATTDDPTSLQIATSVLLTGAISVFLFRSLRRRAKRAKELKFRSSGAKSIKEEALDSLKSMKLADDPATPPSPIQALLGGIAAGAITLILYKFATTVEAGLNRQVISDNFSVRQITITIRTIINGLCYLATFVFGINSVGLILYSGQLAINSFMEGSTSKESSGKDDGNTSTNPLTDSPVDDEEFTSSNEDNSEKTQ